MDSRPVTQKEIAQQLGLSRQAVSLALRGSLHVSAATREKVREVADAMGYHPDPSLSALVQRRTGRGPVATRWNQFALLHNWPREDGLHTSPFYSGWLQCLHQAATAQGITIKEYWVGADSGKLNTVLRKLRNMNITGIFIAPPPQLNHAKKLEISDRKFQTVTFGPEHLYADLHTVQFDFYENLRLAWDVLSRRGRRRIGLVYAEYQSERTGYAWWAAYHIEKILSGCPPEKRMPLLLEDEISQASCDAYRSWLKEHRIDAVISSVYAVEKWSRDLRNPPEVAMFNVNAPIQQGIDINLPQMAETAVDLLLSELRRTQFAYGNHPYRILIPGKWVDRDPAGQSSASTIE
jgi:LacI family transcriptional regulator